MKDINLHLTGKVIAIKHAIPLLKKSQTPRIINIASRLGTKPMTDSVGYCCAEAAVIMLTKVAALELALYGIRVNTVSPALTDTPFARRSYTKDEFANFAKKNPLSRIGKTTDVANVIKFLLSTEAEYINGENINVSGGILLV